MWNRGKGIALHAFLAHHTQFCRFSSLFVTTAYTCCGRHAIISIGRQQLASATNRVIGQNTTKEKIWMCE
jgi:hypothetical protein